MKVLENKYLKNNKIQSFFNGFLQSFDLFGNMNKFKNIYNFSTINDRNYSDSFANVGNSIRRAINIESRKLIK